MNVIKNNKVVILGYANSVHLKRWATGLQSRNYDITLISCGGEPVENIASEIIGEHSSNMIRYLLNKRKVATLIKNIRPNLIHSFLATGYGYWGNGDFNCPKLMTPLGSEITGVEQKSAMYRFLLNRIVSDYDHYSTASDFLKNELNRLFPITRNKVTTIPFGVTIPDQSKNHTNHKPIRLVYLKHPKKIYGPDVLLSSIAILKEKNYPASLDIYGNDNGTEWLRDIVRQKQLDSHVNFKGWLDYKIINDTLLNYDIMVMPSRVESFGVAAVEAGAVGLPVIASNIGGIPEIVENNLTGVLIPAENPVKLASAIMKLGDDFELRNKMGELARKNVMAKFNWNDNLTAMTELYDRLINEWRTK